MTSRGTAIPAAMSGLPPNLARHLWNHATVRSARAGRMLVSHGSTSNNVYIVIEGRLQVMLFSVSGREIILRDLAEGDLFGELAAIDELPRSATITALSDCTLAAVAAASFRDGVTRDPESALWLARRLAGQVRELTDRVFELNALRVGSRLHCELLRRCSSVDDEVEPVTIRPAPTHAELAACIGTHREAVTREIGHLVERGIIEQQRRCIIVKDPIALADLVQQVVGERPQLHS